MRDTGSPTCTVVCLAPFFAGRLCLHLLAPLLWQSLQDGVAQTPRVRRPAPRAAPWPAEETGSRSLRVLVNSRYRRDFICIFVCRGGRVVSLFHSVGVISHVDWSKRASP